jgi:uncharacterized membrane protein YgcG
LAADLPTSVGYVNDFAGKLAPSDRQVLENRLRDYESTTSNEVAVVIVESLDGESVDAYANRLFNAWGVGKKERNNGVMLLWAPAERKVRLEVGRGLEDAIPNTAAVDIVRTVSARFRQEDYVGGLNAGVDAIVARLDAAAPTSAGAPTEAPMQAPLQVPVESWHGRYWPMYAAIAVSVLVLFQLAMGRRQRRIRWAAAVPRDLESMAVLLDGGEDLRTKAVSALDNLRQEAPQEVWDEFPAVVAGAVGELAGLRNDLASIGAMPLQEYYDLRRVHKELERWRAGFSRLSDRINAVGARLDSFHFCRERSQVLLGELREALQRRGQESGWGASAKMVQAATDTYARAETAAAANPANWLLVYDLLMDAGECLEYADNPGGFRRMNRTRNWMVDDVDSPALALMMLQSNWSAGSDVDTSSSMDSSGFSSGDSGGGDSGGGVSDGGGASSDY